MSAKQAEPLPSLAGEKRTAPAASPYFTGNNARQQWRASGFVLKHHTRPLRWTMQYQGLTLRKTHNGSQRKPTAAKDFLADCQTEKRAAFEALAKLVHTRKNRSPANTRGANVRPRGVGGMGDGPNVGLIIPIRPIRSKVKNSAGARRSAVPGVRPAPSPPPVPTGYEMNNRLRKWRKIVTMGKNPGPSAKRKAPATGERTGASWLRFRAQQSDNSRYRPRFQSPR
jgi:hypothetical protein